MNLKIFFMKNICLKKYFEWKIFLKRNLFFKNNKRLSFKDIYFNNHIECKQASLVKDVLEDNYVIKRY